LKLSLLFAKFLYQHRQLNLPGIGVFSIDPSVSIPESTDKNSHEFLQHVRFNQKNITKPDEEFIDFIRTQTGKIRPLAEADLDSFISEGKILLNMGKPFHLEGIGTLQKTREGTYEFHPGLPLLDRLENFFPEKDTKPANTKQPYEHEYNNASKSNDAGKAAWIVLAILVGLGAIIWGGYSLYNRNTDNEGTEATNTTSIKPVTPLADTTQINTTDSLKPVADSSPVQYNAGMSTKPYKFIFRLASKNYVINRYNELKLSNPNIFWDTKDSIVYRLYLAIPAVPGDTARIRDSLRSWYGTKKIIIEQ